jgi:hypothetical protein
MVYTINGKEYVLVKVPLDNINQFNEDIYHNK